MEDIHLELPGERGSNKSRYSSVWSDEYDEICNNYSEKMHCC